MVRGNEAGGIRGVEGEVEMVSRGQIRAELLYHVKESELLSFKPVCLKHSTQVPQKAVWRVQAWRYLEFKLSKRLVFKIM